MGTNSFSPGVRLSSAWMVTLSSPLTFPRGNAVEMLSKHQTGDYCEFPAPGAGYFTFLSLGFYIHLGASQQGWPEDADMCL